MSTVSRTEIVTDTTTVTSPGPGEERTTEIYVTPTVEGEEMESVEVLQARARIEETRAQLTDTIDAIKDKLSPANLVAEATDAAKAATVDKATEVVSNVVESAKDVTATVVDKAADITSNVIDTAKDTAAVVVDKARDLTASATTAVQGAIDNVSEKAAPVIDTAREKLAPAVDVARNLTTTTRTIGGRIVEDIEWNPIPIALIGIGLGWLLFGGKSSRRTLQYDRSQKGDTTYNGRAYTAPIYDENISGTGTARPAFYNENVSGTGTVRSSLYNESVSGIGTAPSANLVQNAGEKASSLAAEARNKVGDMADTVRDTVADTASTVRERAADLTTTVRERAGDVMTVTRDKTQETVSNVDRWVQENPLMAGAAALLIGTAIGLALPATRQENQILGPKRDELANKAAETAQEVVSKVQNVAENVIGTAKNSIGQAVEQVKDTARDEIKNQGLAPV